MACGSELLELDVVMGSVVQYGKGQQCAIPHLVINGFGVKAELKAGS